MAETKRNTAQREGDLAEMAELLRVGWTQRELAEKFDLAVSVVNRDVKEIERRWRKESAQSIDAWKKELILGQKKIVRAAWEEWERSKDPIEKFTETTELIDDPTPPTTPEAGAVVVDAAQSRSKIMEVTKRLVSTEGRVADPRYLTAAQGSLVEIAKIIGAHAADKLEHSGADGAPLLVTIIRDHPPAEPLAEPS